MSQPKYPVAKPTKLGLDKRTTEITRTPRVRVLTVDGVKGVWVPLHPLAVPQNAEHVR